MKQLKYILLLIAGALAFAACNVEDPIDRRLPASEFFVTFETKNGVQKSIAMNEGDTTVVTITMGATRGAQATVDFEIVPPTGTKPFSAEYKVLDMQGNEMAQKTLTFPEGTGAQSFQFVAVDNDSIDGSRTFTAKLLGNSAGYKVGVGGSSEGVTMPLNVKDDEVLITMKELCGEWTVEDIIYYSGKWNEHSYKLTIDSAVGDPTKVTIAGLMDPLLAPDKVVISATVSLNSKVKTITIPAQDINPDVFGGGRTRFCGLANSTFTNNENVGFDNILIEKADDGTLSISLAGAAGMAPYSYLFMGYSGPTLAYAVYARGTSFTKKPQQ